MSGNGYTLHYYSDKDILIVKDSSGNNVKSYQAHGVDKVKLNAGEKRYETARKGTFIIQVIAPVETKGWPLSVISWGKKVVIRPSDMSVWDVSSKRKILSLADSYDRESLLRAYSDMPDVLKKINKGQDIEVPYRFNDFGSIGIKYYKPIADSNGRIDNIFDQKTESIEGTYLHPYPEVEWDRIANKGKTGNLAYSHGCIHMYPEDLDELISKYVVRKFTTITVY